MLEDLVGAKIINDKKYTNKNLIVANNDWDGFCESLKYKNRFHNNMINLENLAFFSISLLITIVLRNLEKDLNHYIDLE